MTRTCLDCSKQIRKSSTGRCLTCFNKSRRVYPPIDCGDCGKALSRTQNKTGYCRTCCLLRGAAEARKNPDYVLKLKLVCGEIGRRNFRDPAIRARQQASRAANAQRRWQSVLSQFPGEYHPTLTRLARSKGLAEAARIIRERYERDRIASLSATRLTSAIDYLRPYAPILPRDNGWLYGTALLTPEQLIERALSKGWQPHAWGIAA